jgi:hypothetical protein
MGSVTVRGLSDKQLAPHGRSIWLGMAKADAYALIYRTLRKQGRPIPTMTCGLRHVAWRMG